MDKGGGHFREGKEVPQGLTAERIHSLSDFKSNLYEIMDLKYNALNSQEGLTFGEREEELKGLEYKYLEDSAHGELWTLKKNGATVGFLALKKTLDRRGATVEQLRFSVPHGRDAFITELFHAVSEVLSEEGYHHAYIDAPHASDDVREVCNRSEFSHFWRFKEKEKSELDS